MNITGVKTIMRTPREKSPQNSFEDVAGVKRMFGQAKADGCSTYANISCIDRLFNTDEKVDDDDDAFDKLISKPKIHFMYTNRAKSLTPMKSAKPNEKPIRKSLGRIKNIKVNVQKWLSECGNLKDKENEAVALNTVIKNHISEKGGKPNSTKKLNRLLAELQIDMAFISPVSTGKRTTRLASLQQDSAKSSAQSRSSPRRLKNDSTPLNRSKKSLVTENPEFTIIEDLSEVAKKKPMNRKPRLLYQTPDPNASLSLNVDGMVSTPGCDTYQHPAFSVLAKPKSKRPRRGAAITNAEVESVPPKNVGRTKSIESPKTDVTINRRGRKKPAVTDITTDREEESLPLKNATKSIASPKTKVVRPRRACRKPETADDTPVNLAIKVVSAKRSRRKAVSSSDTPTGIPTMEKTIEGNNDTTPIKRTRKRIGTGSAGALVDESKRSKPANNSDVSENREKAPVRSTRQRKQIPKEEEKVSVVVPVNTRPQRKTRK